MIFLKIAIALLAAYLIWRVGLAILKTLIQSPPGPPPPGELRKVRITYQCSLCGTQVQMRVAPRSDPEPPRHCMEEMDIVASDE